MATDSKRWRRGGSADRTRPPSIKNRSTRALHFYFNAALSLFWKGSGCGKAVERTPGEENPKRSWVRFLPGAGLFCNVSLIRSLKEAQHYLYFLIKKWMLSRVAWGRTGWIHAELAKKVSFEKKLETDELWHLQLRRDGKRKIACRRKKSRKGCCLNKVPAANCQRRVGQKSVEFWTDRQVRKTD